MSTTLPEGVSFVKPAHKWIETAVTAVFALLSVALFGWMVAVLCEAAAEGLRLIDLGTASGLAYAAGLAVLASGALYLLFYPEGQRACDS
jgi:hypothetical protein